MIVLSSLLALPWLILCSGVLVGASVSWKLMYHRRGGLTVPVLSHIFADLGVVVAAWARTQ
jgi:membrane protease YdiL (CAAX protease family)